MNKKMMCAYRALRVKDMAEAAMGRFPYLVVYVGLALAALLIMGRNVRVALVSLAIMAILAAMEVAMIAAFWLSKIIMRVSGYDEVSLERAALG